MGSPYNQGWVTAGSLETELIDPGEIDWLSLLFTGVAVTQKSNAYLAGTLYMV